LSLQELCGYGGESNVPNAAPDCELCEPKGVRSARSLGRRFSGASGGLLEPGKRGRATRSWTGLVRHADKVRSSTTNCPSTPKESRQSACRSRGFESGLPRLRFDQGGFAWRVLVGQRHLRGGIQRAAAASFTLELALSALVPPLSAACTNLAGAVAYAAREASKMWGSRAAWSTCRSAGVDVTDMR
jgi:hypothetical protein